jgi:hypothetical protein
MKHWWNDTDRVKQSARTNTCLLSQFHFFHHKFHVDRPGIESCLCKYSKAANHLKVVYLVFITGKPQHSAMSSTSFFIWVQWSRVREWLYERRHRSRNFVTSYQPDEGNTAHFRKVVIFIKTEEDWRIPKRLLSKRKLSKLLFSRSEMYVLLQESLTQLLCRLLIRCWGGVAVNICWLPKLKSSVSSGQVTCLSHCADKLSTYLPAHTDAFIYNIKTNASMRHYTEGRLQ